MRRKERRKREGKRGWERRDRRGENEIKRRGMEDDLLYSTFR